MALLTSELNRLKIELGYNGLTLSALPYAFDGITQIFEQIVGVYLEAGELNSSTTAVTAQASPTSVTLALTTTPTAIRVGDRIIVDQDAAQEAAHVSAVTSSSATVALQKAHSGSYPVTVEGGESVVRYYLSQCIAIADKIAGISSYAGIKKADEAEFFASTADQKGVVDELLRLQKYWREELATACGVGPQLRRGVGRGALLESY